MATLRPTEETGPSDSELMARFCRNWDEESFRQLVQRHYRGALLLAEQRLRDPGLAQDAVQDTLMRIVRERTRYDGRQAFAPWFYTILRNVCIDMQRRQFRYREKLDELAAQAEPEPRVGPEELIPSGLAEAFGRLPGLDREILALRLRDGLPFQEIAVLINSTKEAVKKRAQRAFRRLRVVAGDVPAGSGVQANVSGGRRTV